MIGPADDVKDSLKWVKISIATVPMATICSDGYSLQIVATNACSRR